MLPTRAILTDASFDSSKSFVFTVEARVDVIAVQLDMRDHDSRGHIKQDPDNKTDHCPQFFDHIESEKPAVAIASFLFTPGMEA